MIVASNSGLNAVPVEMAELARRRGLRVIAITSLMQSRSTASRAPSGKHLSEVAEVVIDNRGFAGDAVLPVPGAAEEVRMAATSTVSGAAIVQAIMAETVARLAAQGVKAPTLASSTSRDRPGATRMHSGGSGPADPLFWPERSCWRGTARSPDALVVCRQGALPGAPPARRGAPLPVPSDIRLAGRGILGMAPFIIASATLA
jgi:SIS domain